MSVLPWDLVKTAFGKQNGVISDTKILQLHYKISFRVFLISSLLLTAKQAIAGDALSCFEHISNAGDRKDDTLNAYCWVQSTYSVNEYNHDCNVFKDCIYPGVGTLRKGHTTRYHKYYQWTCVTLFFQAILSYIPRFIWKVTESGLQRTLSHNRKFIFHPLLLQGEQNNHEHLTLVVSYFKSHRGRHQSYFLKYCSCEILALMIVIVNILITDKLLGNQFLNFGFDVIRYWSTLHQSPKLANSGQVICPMTTVFPLLAKCDPLKRYGPGGNIITPDPVCILPLNALNSKIYLFLWFYLLFVLGISCLAIVYRLSTVLFGGLRVCLLRFRTGRTKPKTLEDVCKRFYTGDWFAMYLMSNNVSRQFFTEFLQQLRSELYERRYTA